MNNHCVTNPLNLWLRAFFLTYFIRGIKQIHYKRKIYIFSHKSLPLPPNPPHPRSQQRCTSMSMQTDKHFLSWVIVNENNTASDLILYLFAICLPQVSPSLRPRRQHTPLRYSSRKKLSTSARRRNGPSARTRMPAFLLCCTAGHPRRTRRLFWPAWTT